METIDNQSPIIEPPTPSPLVWIAAGLVAAGAFGVLIWQIASIIQNFRRLPFGDAIGSPFWISLGLVCAAVGLLVLELYSIWFHSRRATEVLGTLFSAPAFI